MDSFASVLILLAVFLIIYWYLKRTHTHWEIQNVPSMPDPNFLFGHMLPAITVRESFGEFVHRAYNSFNSSVVGFYYIQKPGIIVRDPELIKSVLKTNFSSFRENFMKLSEKHDPILVKNPFFISDPNLWKERRSRLSNNLSGRKLKYIFVIAETVCNRMVTFAEKKIAENGGVYECELKEYFIRCTGEVVANAAFAIEGQCFEENPGPLSFAEIAKNIFVPSVWNGMKQAFLVFLPDIARFLGVSFLDKKTDSYMRQNINAIVKKRQQTGETPNDYLQFSIESNTDLDGILGDVVNFYGDVYETSSTAMANLFYHLSQYPDIQTKLREHVNSVLKETNGQVTYESLKNMTYLDQVLQESQRLIPPAIHLMKCCTDEITLTGSDGLSCHLKPGNPVFIPIWGVQLDEKYWPNPEVFDPERFAPENQANQVKCSYLPFGEGPRMCVGMRTGLMLVKQATATLITKYSIEHSPKTKVPLKVVPGSILLGFEGGLWARFKKLDQH